MVSLTNDELKNIQGGELSIWACVGIAAIVTFLAGVIDGIVHPKRCG